MIGLGLTSARKIQLQETFLLSLKHSENF